MNAPAISTDSRRDAGLERAMGTWGLAAAIFNVIVGAGIFAVPAELSAAVGAWAPLVFLFCGIAVGATAICFAEGGSRVPTSGGVYGYIETALGPFAGYLGGTLLWVGAILANGGVAAALADAVGTVTPAACFAVIRPVVIVGTIGLIAAVNIAGVRHGVRLVAVATAFKLVPLAIFLLAGAFAFHGANFSAVTAHGGTGLGAAVLTALFAAQGMESALAASGEVRQPSRAIPKALLLAIASTTLLYIIVQCIAQGVLGAGLPGSHAALADAMGRISPTLRVLMLAGITLSLFGWMSSDILVSPRLLFALARDRMLPAILGHVHPQTRTPWVAIASYALGAAVLALTGSFGKLVVLAALTSTVLYIGGCFAAWKLKRAGISQAGAPLDFRWLGTAAVIGSASMVVMIALAGLDQILGLAALIAIATLVYGVQIWFKRSG